MAIAVLATVFGPRVTAAGIPWIIGAMVAGGASASTPRAPCR
jgi:NAD(P) transhydrogenase subunit beta